MARLDDENYAKYNPVSTAPVVDEQIKKAAANKIAEDARVAAIVAAKQKEIDARPPAEKTDEQKEAYNNAKALAESFVTQFGGSLSDYFNSATGQVTAPKGPPLTPTPKPLPPPLPTPDPKKPKFGEPGYVLKFGDPGYILQPGDPGYKPVGTPDGYVLKPDGTWGLPNKPDLGTFAFDPNAGYVATSIAPGSTGMQQVDVPGSPGGIDKLNERTLAKDTFKNTLALFFGPAEISKSWVDGVYKSISGFYKTGSTIAEALNLAVQDVRNNPDLADFTKRFKGVYALTDRLAKGEAIEVPTIAEYFKSESDIGDILRNTGLGELATQDFIGDVLGRGKSVLEVGNLINQTFNSIDNAPKELKDTLATYFPSVDRTSLAQAMLTGTAGAAELDRKIKGISVLSAAGTQGVKIGMEDATNIASMGYDYNQSLQGFGTVKQLGRATELGAIGNIDITQQEIQSSVFGQNQAAKDKLARIKAAEEARMSGSSGNAPGAFSTAYLKKSSVAGQI